MPSILAKAQAIGYKGPDDIAKLLAYGQGMMKNAPNADTAGNNFVNLLNKIPSKDLATQAAKIKVGKYGIDMAGTFNQAREKGIDPVSALVGLTDVIAQQNPEFRKLDDKLKNTDKNSPEYQSLLESQRRILESSEIGQLISDQQALMGLLAAREYRGYIQQVEHESKKQLSLPKGQGEGYVSFAVVANENEFKLQQAKEQADFAEMRSVKPISDAVGTLSEQFTQLSKDFPVFTSALMSAKTGIEAMTQAAVAFAALKFLFNGKGGIPGRGGSAGGVLDTITGGDAVPVKITNWEGMPDRGDGSIFGEILKKFGLYAETISFFNDSVDDKKLEETRNKITDKTDKQYIDAGIDPKDKNGWIPTDIHIWWKNLGRDDADIRQKRDELMSVPAYGAPLAPEDVAKASAAIAANAISELIKSQQRAPLPIEVRSVVELDGHVVAEAVNNINGNDAGRTTGGEL